MIIGGIPVAITLSPRLTRFLLRLGFAFEPLAPTAISYFLVRYLRDWYKQGLISDYRARTKRLGRFHYQVEIDVEVNEKQANYVFDHYLARRINGLGR